MALGVDPNSPFGEAPELQAMLEQARRRQQMAQLMQQRIMQSGMPVQNGPVASRMNPLTPLLQALGTYITTRTQNEAGEDAGRVGEKFQAAVGAERDQAMSNVDPTAQIAQLLTSRFGQNRDLAQGLSREQQRLQTSKHQDNQDAMARERFELDGKRFGLDEKQFAASEEYKKNYLGYLNQQLADARQRGDRTYELQLKQHQADLSRLGLERQRVAQAGERIAVDREEMAQRERLKGVAPAGPPPKPIPASAMKVITEDVNTVGTLGRLNKDLATFEQSITEGRLQLGPVRNLVARGRNLVGQSDENSRLFGSFKAGLEKLRNDSLRLNKGVQTEGDSVRAWNELFENLNDSEFVKTRLQEIQRINEEGAALKKIEINTMRRNFNHEDMDFSEVDDRKGSVELEPRKPSLADVQAEIARRKGGK